MRYCSEIPAAAWQQLEGATWQKLKTVSFYERLGTCTCWSGSGILSWRWFWGCGSQVRL